MAGDWLKFDKATPDKPEVFAIATELNIDPDAVVGKLMRVWSWFDSHTENGNAPSVTSALLDRIAGVSGFVTSMQKTGWIVVYEGGISLPNFTRHCGETAKKRAQNNNRVSKYRSALDNANNGLDECNAQGVTSALQKHVPEKRREEKNKEQESKALVVPKARPSRKAPTDFTVTTEMLGWALMHAPGVNVHRETASFMDHTFATGKTDWLGTWRNWMRRSSDKSPRQPVRDKSPADKAMRLFHESQAKAGQLELSHE